MAKRPLSGKLSEFFEYDNVGTEGEALVFLGNRSDADWARIAERSERRRFVAGEELIRAGETDRSLMIVVDGTVDVLQPDERGGVQHLQTIEGGSVIGEIAFFDGRPRAATVRAATGGHLLRLSFDDFEALAARYPELGRAILLDLGRLLAVRLRRMNLLVAQADAGG